MDTPPETALRPMPPLPSTLADAAVRPLVALRWSAHAVLPRTWPGRVDLPSSVVVRVGDAR